jgi:hypothetical protein
MRAMQGDGAQRPDVHFRGYAMKYALCFALGLLVGSGVVAWIAQREIDDVRREDSASCATCKAWLRDCETLREKAK